MRGIINKATRPVPILKMTCASTTRLAFAVAPSDANTAVDVVPTFAPMTIAAAACNSTTPETAAVIVSAIDALEDWVKIVITMPIAKYISIPEKPSAVNFEISNVVISPSNDAFKISTPTKNRPNPTSAKPNDAILSLGLIKRIIMPIPIRGKANA